MATRSRLLRVPYFTQPTENSCQSTVLKMFSTNLEREILKSDNGAIALEPVDVYKTIDSSPKQAQLREQSRKVIW